MAFKRDSRSAIPNDETDSTLVVLGCGALGTAILSGVLASLDKPEQHFPVLGWNAKSSLRLPFTRYVACVRRHEAADAIRSKIESFKAATKVSIFTGENIRGVAEADVVLLAVQPQMIGPLFDEPGLKRALVGKLIISVVAGVSKAGIESHLQSPTDSIVIRAMPNAAAVTRQSATVIERPGKDVPEALVHLTETLFQCVGQTFHVDPANMDVCTVLCGSTPSFFTLILEGLVEGSISLGLNHTVALRMAAHSMLGTASMASSGIAPQDIRHAVATPGGSSIQGLLTLEDGRVRALFANALRAATLATSGLGAHQRHGTSED